MWLNLIVPVYLLINDENKVTKSGQKGFFHLYAYFSSILYTDIVSSHWAYLNSLASPV